MNNKQIPESVREAEENHEGQRFCLVCENWFPDGDRHFKNLKDHERQPGEVCHPHGDGRMDYLCGSNYCGCCD